MNFALRMRACAQRTHEMQFGHQILTFLPEKVLSCKYEVDRYLPSSFAHKLHWWAYCAVVETKTIV